MSEEEKNPLSKEKPTFDDEAKWDSSKRAEAVLDHVLSSDSEIAKPVTQGDEQISVSEAIHSRPVIDRDSGRNRARVLIVTTDESVFTKDSSTYNHYLRLSEQLDEVHVFCLIPRGGKEGIDRMSDNLWLYKICSKNWWWLPWKAKSSALEALVWNKVPRPDVIVGIDPFEAGLAAKIIAKKLKRPWQLHIYTDPFREDFIKKSSDNNWRLRIAKYLLKRTKSIRTNTTSIQQSIVKRYKKIIDISTLPRFHNFTDLVNTEPNFSLQERYPDFVFIILAFGPLSADSYLHTLFASLNRLLHNQRIGLVVVGDGPAKHLFTEKVKILGIEKSVVFLKDSDDMVSLLKTASVLIEMDQSEDGEVRILQAATAGLPAVAVRTDLREDVFKDGESVFLCDPNDTICFAQKTSKFINNSAIRTQLARNAQTVALERVNEDPNAHYHNLALNIESVLV